MSTDLYFYCDNFLLEVSVAMKSQNIYHAYISIHFTVGKKTLRKQTPRNVYIFWPIYSQHTIKASLLGEWKFLNILSLYSIPLIRSLSWNRLKSSGREVRTQAYTLLHSFACAYVHAQSEEYTSRIMVGRRENCACSFRPRLSHPLPSPIH